VPEEFGPAKNLVWRAEMPAGKSSPVFAGNRIFVTAHDGDKLLTIAVDRRTGRESWRRHVTRTRQEKRHKLNDAAAATPVTDGKRVYLFFPDFGLAAYDVSGRDLWRLPLDAMPSMHGVAASPITHADKLIVVSDQAETSYIMAVNARNGEIAWKQQRRPAPGGAYSSPVIYRTERGEDQVITFSAYELIAYAPATGEKLWWVGGLPAQPKSTPTVVDGVIYCYARGLFGDAAPLIRAFASELELSDKNKDGKLQKDEVPEGPVKQYFGIVDRNKDGGVDAVEWGRAKEAIEAKSAFVAVKPSGRGDLTRSAVLWKFERNMSEVPSPLVYKGVLYMVQSGGIFSTLDPATGKVSKQGRLAGALGDYYASPVAAGGVVLAANQNGQVSVIRAGADWELMAVNNLDDELFATPAVVDDALYVRTGKALWCFAKAKK
jgi:outer membrane protein assembly factor BamB